MSAPIDHVALSLLPLWRWRAVAEQLRSGLSPLDVLNAHCADGARRGARRPSWADPGIVLERARQALARAASSRIVPVLFGSETYPPLLAEIVDPPPVLWIAGNPAALHRPTVAIVGSRAGSTYALQMAERLASDLAARAVAVVSGLARGVDSAAHRGALAVHGITVGVLGCGVDIVYPPENDELVGTIVSTGAVVSEFVPGTIPKPAFFPRRNRIISGLSRAVVIVEAGEKSGSLITARCALEQGRDVLAVPGNALTGRNRGGHALLRDGARLVETADDVLEELGIAAGLAAGSAGSAEPESADPDPVVAALTPGEGVDLEVLAARTGLSAAVLLPRLLNLELRGTLRREPGGRFVRLGQTC